jgi:hypothetical protein
MDDRVLHAELTYWREGERDHELWGLEEMVYLTADRCRQFTVTPHALEFLWRMIDKKLTGQAMSHGADKLNPISWRTLSVKDIPQ